VVNVAALDKKTVTALEGIEVQLNLMTDALYVEVLE
jgi:hypothetical protein